MHKAGKPMWEPAKWKRCIKSEQGKQRTLVIKFLLFKRRHAKLKPLQDSVNDMQAGFMKQVSPGWAITEELQEHKLIGTLHSGRAFPARAMKQGLKCHSPRRGLKDSFQEMTMKARNCFRGVPAIKRPCRWKPGQGAPQRLPMVGGRLSSSAPALILAWHSPCTTHRKHREHPRHEMGNNFLVRSLQQAIQKR